MAEIALYILCHLLVGLLVAFLIRLTVKACNRLKLRKHPVILTIIFVVFANLPIWVYHFSPAAIYKYLDIFVAMYLFDISGLLIEMHFLDATEI